MKEEEINAKIEDYETLKEVIELLNKAPEMNEKAMEAIAILSNALGYTTFKCKFLPKNKVYIGTGEEMPFDLSKGPEIKKPK